LGQVHVEIKEAIQDRRSWFLHKKEVTDCQPILKEERFSALIPISGFREVYSFVQCFNKFLPIFLSDLISKLRDWREEGRKRNRDITH